MKTYQNYLTVGLLALLLTGCTTTDTQQNTYPSTSGVIIATKPVTLAGSGGIGTFAGMAAGAYGGSQLTKNKKARIADTAAGAVLGALVGDMAEHALTRKQGTEYIVKTVNGTVVTVDQPTDPSLQINQRVVVLYQDNKPKLIADNSMPENRMEVHHHHHHYYHDDDED